MAEATRRSPSWLALKAALVYGTIAVVWIVLSDAAVVALGFDSVPMVQTYKGLSFVVVTAMALFFVVRGYLVTVFRANREANAARERLESIQRLLGDVNSFVMRSDLEAEMYGRVASAIVETGVFEGAWVAECRPGRDTVVLLATAGSGGEGFPSAVDVGQECAKDDCSIAPVFEHGAPLIDNHVVQGSAGECLSSQAGTGVRSLAAFPIIYGDSTVAALCVFSKSRDAFGDAEASLLERLATDISVGVGRVRESEQTRSLLARVEASERRYRELFETNPRPMWVYDLETLRFLDVNDAATEHYGYSREEFLGMSIADIRPGEDMPRLLDNIARVTGGVDFAGVWNHLTKDGRTILVDVTSHTLEYEGRKAELVLADDVTALVEATGELRRTAARLSAIVNTAAVVILTVDREGLITEWNPTAEQLFGWSAEEAIGERLPVITREDEDIFGDALRRSVSEGSRLRIESRNQARDGSPVDVVVYTSPLASPDGAIEEVLAVVVDVSEQKRAEEELRLYRERLEELVEARTQELATLNERLSEATRVKSEFLANMSHELRTPLNSIIGFSGILLQGLTGELTGEQIKQIGMVHRSGKHLLELINDILDLSRIEAGRVTVESVSFDLAALARSVADELSPLATAKGLQVSCHEGPRFAIRSDRTKIRQILYNLVGNGIKFTEDGTVAITLEGGGDHVMVHVADTGCGIAQGDLEVIFDEFHQARRRADEKPTGTGLGLAISRKLANMLGGDLTVTSSRGQGSRFTLTIPLSADGDADRSSEG